MKNWLWLALILPLLQGCASIGGDSSVSVASVQQDAASFVESELLWGGRIVAVENGQDRSELTVLSLPLDVTGRPMSSQDAGARFIARVQGFIDPAEFSEDRLVSVRGKVKGIVKRKVGDYDYQYPVLDALEVRLWQEQVNVRVYAGYGSYPYYGGWGWYPYGYYPYWWY